MSRTIEEFTIAFTGKAAVQGGESLQKLLKEQVSALELKNSQGNALKIVELKLEDVKTKEAPISHFGMTEEGRHRVSLAMKRRWKKFRRIHSLIDTHKEAKKTFGMSLASRQHISQLMKERWARVKALTGGSPVSLAQAA